MVTNLHAAPTYEHAQEELSLASSHLQDIENYKLEGQWLRSRLKWKQKGDQGSKEYFLAHKHRSSASRITVLEDPHGQLYTN